MSNLEAKSIIPLHAGFWRRAAASVVDSLVLVIPNVAVTLVLPELLALLGQLVVSSSTSA